MKRILSLTALATMLCLLATGMASAVQTTDTIPSVAYDEIVAKLMGAGYHDIRVIDPEVGKISAIDEFGTEVVLVVDENTRRILNEICVHGSDD